MVLKSKMIDFLQLMTFHDISNVIDTVKWDGNIYHVYWTLGGAKGGTRQIRTEVIILYHIDVYPMNEYSNYIIYGMRQYVLKPVKSIVFLSPGCFLAINEV